MSTSRYPFLELLKESEAVARGANLGDKAHHTVFRMIRSMSTLDNAKAGSLYTLDVSIPELATSTKKELALIVKRLIADKLVSPLFLLWFEAADSSLRMQPCYISIPADEKLTLQQLYYEVVGKSVNAVEAYIDTLPLYQRDQIWLDLELDFSAKALPPAEKLIYSVIDPFSSVHPANFDLLPSAEMIRVTSEDITEELIKRNKVVRLNDYGLLAVKEKEMIERFETCSDHLKAQLIPRYRNIGNSKKELEKVTLEEANYFSEDFKPSTTEYTLKRAQIIKKAALSEPGRTGHFQGALTIEQILKVEPIARRIYAEKAKKERETLYNEIYTSLTDPGESWKDSILFLKEEDRASLPPAVFQSLLDDSTLMDGTWETPSSTVYVIVERNPDIIRNLITGMLDSDLEAWKILALRFLIDKYESDISFLFQDPDFVNLYGKLLRQAYIDYIPWYYKIFVILGLRLFQDTAFQLAKKKILGEQEALAQKNQERKETERIQQENEKKARLERIADMEISNRIVEKLNHAYFEEKTIPLVREIRSSLPDIKPDEVSAVINREGFQLIQGSEDTGFEECILVYPVNHEWRSRSAKIRRMIESVGEKGGQVFAERARVLLASLKRRNAGGQNIMADSEDPYEKLDRIIHEKKRSPD